MKVTRKKLQELNAHAVNEGFFDRFFGKNKEKEEESTRELLRKKKFKALRDVHLRLTRGEITHAQAEKIRQIINNPISSEYRTPEQQLAAMDADISKIIMGFEESQRAHAKQQKLDALKQKIKDKERKRISEKQNFKGDKMKITRRQLRQLIIESIEDLDFFDQGKVFTALKTLPADHRAKVEDFLNNVLKITADEFNRIEDDDGIIAKIKDYVKEYKSNNNIDDLLAKIKNLLR